MVPAAETGLFADILPQYKYRYLMIYIIITESLLYWLRNILNLYTQRIYNVALLQLR